MLGRMCLCGCLGPLRWRTLDSVWWLGILRPESWLQMYWMVSQRLAKAMKASQRGWNNHGVSNLKCFGMCCSRSCSTRLPCSRSCSLSSVFGCYLAGQCCCGPREDLGLAAQRELNRYTQFIQNYELAAKIIADPVTMERKINNGTKHIMEEIEKLSDTVDNLDV